MTTMKTNSEFYKTVLDNFYEGIYFVDTDRNITYWNNGATRLCGFKSEEVIGRRCSDNILIHVDDQGTQLCKGTCFLAQTLRDGKIREAEVFAHHKDGYRIPVSVRVVPLHDENNNIIGAVQIFNDNSLKRSIIQENEKLKKLALLDPLTEVGNRRYAEENLRSIHNEASRYSWPFGVLFFDIDHFKNVNDTFGHDVGDLALKMVANTLAKNVRSFDLVCRWGGEEFIGIIKNVTAEQLKIVADKLRFLVEGSSFSVNGNIISVTISVGGSTIRGGDMVDSLLKRVDQLMYQSKSSGRNCVTID